MKSRKDGHYPREKSMEIISHLVEYMDSMNEFRRSIRYLLEEFKEINYNQEIDTRGMSEETIVKEMNTKSKERELWEEQQRTRVITKEVKRNYWRERSAKEAGGYSD